MFETWRSTVRRLRTSRSAISWLLIPSPISARISSSRPVSPDGIGRGRCPRPGHGGRRRGPVAEQRLGGCDRVGEHRVAVGQHVREQRLGPRDLVRDAESLEARERAPEQFDRAVRVAVGGRDHALGAVADRTQDRERALRRRASGRNARSRSQSPSAWRRLDEGDRLVLVLLEAREPSAVDDPLGGGGARLGLAERDQDARVEGLRPTRLVVRSSRPGRAAPGRDRSRRGAPAINAPISGPPRMYGADEDVRAADGGEVLVDERRGLAQSPRWYRHHRTAAVPWACSWGLSFRPSSSIFRAHRQRVGVGTLDVGERRASRRRAVSARWKTESTASR